MPHTKNIFSIAAIFGLAVGAFAQDLSLVGSVTQVGNLDYVTDADTPYWYSWRSDGTVEVYDLDLNVSSRFDASPAVRAGNEFFSVIGLSSLREQFGRHFLVYDRDADDGIGRVIVDGDGNVIWKCSASSRPFYNFEDAGGIPYVIETDYGDSDNDFRTSSFAYDMRNPSDIVRQVDEGLLYPFSLAPDGSDLRVVEETGTRVGLKYRVFYGPLIDPNSNTITYEYPDFRPYFAQLSRRAYYRLLGQRVGNDDRNDFIWAGYVDDGANSSVRVVVYDEDEVVYVDTVIRGEFSSAGQPSLENRRELGKLIITVRGMGPNNDNLVLAYDNASMAPLSAGDLGSRYAVRQYIGPSTSAPYVFYEDYNTREVHLVDPVTLRITETLTGTTLTHEGATYVFDDLSTFRQPVPGGVLRYRTEQSPSRYVYTNVMREVRLAIEAPPSTDEFFQFMRVGDRLFYSFRRVGVAGSDSDYDVYEVTGLVGASDVAALEATVTPSLSTDGVIRLRTPTTAPISAKVFDAAGRELETYADLRDGATVQLPAGHGAYLVLLQDDTGAVAVSRVVRQ